MRLVVLSFFRNSMGYQIQRFMRQCAELTAAYSAEVLVVAVHGDSVDGTGADLKRQAEAYKVKLHMVEHNHGGPDFGSVEAAQRMKQLSGVANAGLDAVFSLTHGRCYIWYVESDLIWDAPTVMHLLGKLEANEEADALAPLIFAGGNFYDVYSYRGLDGSRFAPFPPYHSTMKAEGLTEVSSVGSSFVMRGKVVRGTRIRNDGALPGFWEDARARGHRVFVDPAEKVRHPA